MIKECSTLIRIVSITLLNEEINSIVPAIQSVRSGGSGNVRSNDIADHFLFYLCSDNGMILQ